MADLFTESLALQRVDLFARMVAYVVGDGVCSEEDKEVAILWFAELTRELTKKIDDFEKSSNKH